MLLLFLLLLLLLLPLLLLSLQRCRACIGSNFDLSFLPLGAQSYTLATRTSTNTNHPGLAPGVDNVLFSLYSYLSSFVSPFSLCGGCVCVCVCVRLFLPLSLVSSVPIVADVATVR